MFARFLRRLQELDWVLILCALTLFAFGLSAIYSVELSRESRDFVLLQKQLIAFGLGMAIFIFLSVMSYVQLRNYARILYLIGIILLVLVLIFGSTVRGTTGWFDLGPVSFQPVEFMKFALVCQLARYFGEHARRRFGWREILGSGFLTAVPAGLTLLQPDLGSASILVGIWIVFMFFSGIRWHHSATLLGGLIFFAVFGWLFVFQDYQKDRVAVFLNPALDPLVTGYNIEQAKIAIGSGQLFGRGLGFGSQSQLKFLPESQTDFVFAVIAEELGFIGVLVVFVALALMLWRLLAIARHARDNFTAFLLIGIFAAFFVQGAVNIGVNLAIVPATGVSLPLVSYGGSSLLVSLALIGVAQSIVRRSRPADKLSTPWYN